MSVRMSILLRNIIVLAKSCDYILHESQKPQLIEATAYSIHTYFFANLPTQLRALYKQVPTAYVMLIKMTNLFYNAVTTIAKYFFR